MKYADNRKETVKLIKLAKNGDKEAFSSLYKIYFVPIYRFIYLRVQNKSLAEDFTQTVFIKVYEAISDFRIENKTPLNYFFTVARNTIIDYWRKKKDLTLENPNIIAKEGQVDMAENIHNIIQREEQSKILQNIIQYLTKDQQEIIILKFIDDLSTKEIAEIVGKTEEAVRQLQSRALKSIRSKLKDSKIL